jgi:hypothetical protein
MKMITNEQEEEEENINEKFLSFSLLEEEKKDSIQKIEKHKKSSTIISDQDSILTDNNQEKVKQKLFFNFVFLGKLIFIL